MANLSSALSKRFCRSAIWFALSSSSRSPAFTRSRRAASSSRKALSSGELCLCEASASFCMYGICRFCVRRGKTRDSSAPSICHAPDVSFIADIFPDFMARVMVATFLPVASAAWFALYCMGVCDPLHCTLRQGFARKGTATYSSANVAGKSGSIPSKNGCETGGSPSPEGICRSPGKAVGIRRKGSSESN